MVGAGQALSLSVFCLTATIGIAAAEPVQIAVNGQERAYLLERPAVPGPHPTLIMLHGAGGTAAGESGLGPVALAHGFAAVFPDGRGRRWNFHPPGQATAVDVQFFQQHGGVPDDVAFLKAIIVDLVRRGISDPKRVHLVGFSLGGVMALRMTWIHADLFAAIAVLVSAMADVNGANCRPATPLPALILSGTADPLIPYAGGRTNRGDVLWPAERLVAFFRRLNGCSEPALSSAVWNPQPQAIEVELSAKCAGGPVAFYRIVGGGHNIPPVLDGRRMLLDFFHDKVR
jgi:polyhydroxybutyrate depolymerase